MLRYYGATYDILIRELMHRLKSRYWASDKQHVHREALEHDSELHFFPLFYYDKPEHGFLKALEGALRFPPLRAAPLGLP